MTGSFIGARGAWGASLVLLACLLGQAPASAAEATKPSRIVSLNMCTDELLLRLADRNRIASVTWLSQDARAANLPALAAAIPANHGLAEEVLAARPDLVVAGRYTTRVTVGILRQAGIPVVEFGVAGDLDAVFGQIRDFAAAIGEPARAEALIGAMKARLRILGGAGDMRPRAFVLRPHGFTAGAGSLVDDILTRAGLDNLAARLDLGPYGQVPLETVALTHADLLVIDAEPGGPTSLATEILHHPLVAALGQRLTIVSLPSRLWTCAGPSVIDAIERLAAYARPEPAP